MSLILLSNDPSESSGLVGSRQNIYKPWSFRNSLTETIKIPKNSQVALTSCKIALDGQISISPNNKVFYMYLGETLGKDGLRDTMQSSTSIPIRCELFPDSDEVVTTTPEGLANEISRVIEANMWHPAYNQIATGTAKCLVKRDSDGDFAGYTFNIVNGSVNVNGAPVTSIDPEDGLIKSTLIQTRCGVDWSFRTKRTNPALRNYALTSEGGGTTIRLTPNDQNRNMMATTFLHEANCLPCVNTDGIISFDIADVMTRPGGTPGTDDKNIPFICGLSRPCTSNQFAPNGGKLGTPYFKWNWAQLDGVGSNLNDMLRGYCDFAVVNDGLTLRLFNTNNWGGGAVRPGVGGGNLTRVRWQEVDYTENGNAEAPFPARYNTVTNVSDFRQIRFALTGNQIQIDLINLAGVVTSLWRYSVNRYKRVGDPDVVRTLAEQCKPLDIGCWDMQPVMGIYNHNWPAVNLGTHLPTDYNIELTFKDQSAMAGTGQRTYTMDSNLYNGTTVLMSYYEFLLQSDRESFNKVFPLVDKRDPTQLPFKYGTYDTSQKKFVSCLQPVIISSPSVRYVPTNQASLSPLFGFTELFGVTDTWVGAESGGFYEYTTDSTGVPKNLSTKSIFVRLENFAQTSINAGNGNKSSIIAHLPRFDGQNQTGRLFFEPKNLLYLDLKNATELNINSFDISFVYADESYCKSLVGTSNVVLHIREKKS